MRLAISLEEKMRVFIGKHSRIGFCEEFKVKW